MKKRYQSLVAVAAIGSSTLLFTGCGGGSTNTATVDASSTNATAAQSTTITDPSFQPKIVESTDSAPQQTVGVFLDSLRRGDETTANSMLTELARAELQKTQYAIQPLGTPEGQFKIGRLGFPYEDQTVALVESQWREPATPTDPELVMDIVCEVHKEAAGWRIAGMAVTIVGDTEALVIDFEDGRRLQEMLEIANAPATEQAATTQPGMQVALPGAPGPQPVPNQPQIGQLPPLQPGQLPPLPGAGSGANTQIATPPGGNVLR